MARRFNYEPINLINRIPSPKQMDEARPTGPSLGQSIGQLIVRAGGVCWRKAIDLVKHVTRYEEESLVGSRVRRALPPPYGYTPMAPQEPVVSRPAYNHVNNEPSVEEKVKAAEVLPREEHMHTPEGGVGRSAGQGTRPEEVAALRSYLIGQQQDIASLTAQIRELKSLVTSQQQVIVHLGEELETGAFQTAPSRSASAAPRRDRIVREKPIAKDTSKAHGETESASLNL